jgi:hypothetical protein
MGQSLPGSTYKEIGDGFPFLEGNAEFDDIHIAQCLNYLKITGLKLCLLINFSKPRVDIKRIVRGFGNK